MHSDYSEKRWRGVRGAAGVLIVSALTGMVLVGCVHYHAEPLAAGKVAADFEGRSLTDAGLRAFLETNQVSGEWPRRSWELESLTLAAFYFSPELDVARAQWGTARAGSRTAAQVPNPTLNVTPGYNATTFMPSPWIPLGFLDIPIETAGKRGYRMAQGGHLSEAAKLNILGTAWQVRGKLRRALVDFYAASEQERLLAAQQAAQEENVKLLEGQLAAGAVSPAVVTRERIALDTTRLAEQDAKRQRGQSRVAVAEAIGIPVGALDAVEISFVGMERVPPGLDTPAGRRQALLGRADVLASLAEYAASQSALQLEIARQYPDLHIGPGYQYDQGNSKWSLALTVTLPVFNQNQGPIVEAVARREESAAKFNALQARVVAEVERGLLGYRTALVRVTLPKDAGLRPGQFVRVRIVSEERTGRLAVPRESVVKVDDAQVIYMVEGVKAKQKAVKVGVHDGSLVEVEGEGLKEGDAVVTVGAYGLPEETKIKVIGQ